MRKTHIFTTTYTITNYARALVFVLILAICAMPSNLMGKPKSVLHIDGTYDLDQDGLSELLLVVRQPDGSTMLEYVEIDKAQNHQTLWTYAPPAERTGLFTDVKIVNLDGLGPPELVGILQTSYNSSEFGKPWLYVFRWVGDTFTSVPLIIADERLEGQFIRPGNLSYFGKHTEGISRLAISLGSPLREILIFSVDFQSRPWRLIGEYYLQPLLFKNGYGRVYTATFLHDNRELLAVFSPEGNLLKTVIYDLEPEPHEILADVLTINGARFLLAPEIMATDFNMDGNQELLLPFQNGDLSVLSVDDGKLALEMTDLNGLDLFILQDPASENDINNMIIARVENGLYTTLRAEPVKIASVSKQEVEEIEELVFPIGVTIEDTIYLGQQFQRSVATDSAAEFYSFQWLQTPPLGSNFDPQSELITWTPVTRQIGPHLFNYKAEYRIGEKVLVIEDEGAVRHQIVPVLSEETREFGVLVLDTVTFIAGGVMELPERGSVMELYSVAALIPDIKKDKRFIFEGVPPFGLTTAEFAPRATARSLMHSISADVTNISEDKRISFSYTSPEVLSQPVTTFKIIHDTDNNLMTLLFIPGIDAARQSLYPEDLFPELYQFPEYYFSGFPEGVGIDLLGDKIQFTITDDSLTHDTQLSFVGITSPSNPAHLLTLYFNQGDLEAMRGEVKILPTRGKKIVTEFDFVGPFNPVRISTQLRKQQDFAAVVSGLSPGEADTLSEQSTPETAILSQAGEKQIVPNYALRFEPGDYVKIYDNDNYDFSVGNLTLESWVFLSAANISEQIISKKGEFHLKFDESGYLEFWTAREETDGVTLISPNILAQNSWVHIAGIQDTAGMRLYENGVLIAENTSVGSIPNNNNPIYLGGWNFFTGQLDELHISGTGRYTNNFEPITDLETGKSTLGLWHFNQGHGLQIIDASKDGSSGEIFGAKWSLIENKNAELPDSSETIQ